MATWKLNCFNKFNKTSQPTVGQFIKALNYFSHIRLDQYKNEWDVPFYKGSL